jgi:NAD-reducing hydrogenase large subunit
MAQTITIDPVTRIEGHGRVVINLDAAGQVSEATFQTLEFRGFEKFCEGRMLWDLPTLTSRICGFCPVSHHLASVKACEALLGVEPPRPATLLRELLLMGQFIQSHALHYFFCAMPDFLGAAPADRNAFSLVRNNPDVALRAIKLRKVGQDIVDRVGGGRLHPVACIPGGMTRHLDYMDRVELFKGVVTGAKIAKQAVDAVKTLHQKNHATFETFASFPSLYLGLAKEGQLSFYDGAVQVIDGAGKEVEQFAGADYAKAIGEVTNSKSWTKAVHLKSRGPVEGSYRVGPLARVNIAKSVSTPQANAELQEFKQLSAGKPVQPALYYHYARMIELLYAVERAHELLKDPDILSAEVRVPVERKGGEGVGVLEAPRGTLFHHYQANEDGRVTKVNLIVSTAHNKTAMDRSVTAVAKSLVVGGKIEESKLNMVEMAVRCYDPCLSCTTHAYGNMPLEVSLVADDGRVLERHLRGGDVSA